MALTGYVDEADSTWGGVYSRFAEHVPELAYDRAPYVYAMMRRDPQLAAVLQAYTLPIVRAACAVDPAGVPGATARMVADDLGLPLLGEDPQPGAARTTGVTWSRHALQALMTMLTFGHAPYELEADIGERTRLVGLWERLPHTIEEFDTDTATGELTAAYQERPLIARGAPLRRMARDRLLWYVRNREGSNWRGVSMLRPAYGAWLLKNEMWRVHAISNRRNGAGIPVMEPLAGTQPSEAQIEAAARMAAASRVGDQAGAATVPGFRMRLVGLEGSVPDTLAFIRYLDQQMSRMALAGMLDLGDTPNGSRALGSEFVDLFMLSLQTTADDFADTLTRDAARRIVDWNVGEDAPCPRIVIGEVGADHNVTAEALQLLLASGALSADPQLEQYVRRAWRLPQRTVVDAPAGQSYGYDLDYGILTVDERRAQVGLPPKPDGSGDQVPVPSSERGNETQVAAAVNGERRRRGLPPARVRARTPRADDGTDVRLRRQPNSIEAAAGTDFDAVHTSWVEALDELVEAWTSQVAPLHRAALLEQVQAAVADGAIDALAVLEVDTSEAADLLGRRMVTLADEAAAQMREEAASQGVKVGTGKPSAIRLHGQAQVAASVMGRGMANSAAREALRAWAASATDQQVRDRVAEHLESLTDSSLRDGIGQALSAAQNEGRLAVLREAPKARYAASEIMDVNTCEPCLEVDGETYDSLDEAEQWYGSGGYAECLGGARCRGIVVAVWDEP